MEIQLTLNGRKRKEAADCVGEAVNAAPVYAKAPTYAFDIGGIVLDRHGVLTMCALLPPMTTWTTTLATMSLPRSGK